MQNNYKIAIVIDDAYGFGGTERVLSNMVSILSEKYSVDIFSVKKGACPFYDLSAANALINGKHNKYLASIWSITSELKKGQYTHVFVITMGRLSCFFGLICKLKNLFVKTKVYACEHVAYESYSFLIQLIKKVTSPWYSHIIVLTQENKNWIATYTATPVSVIPNEAPHIPEKELGGNYDHKKALFVGRLAQQKRIDNMLRLWKIFKSTDVQGWRLEIVGDGEEKNKLISLTRKLCIEDSVIFRGRSDNTQVEYQNASIFLMTSEYEGFPMVLLEAQAHGLPCLAYDCPTGPMDIVDNGRSGFVVSSDEDFIARLQQLCTDKCLFEKMRIAARVNSQRFSRATITEKWIKVVG